VVCDGWSLEVIVNDLVHPTRRVNEQTCILESRHNMVNMQSGRTESVQEEQRKAASIG
jgi:hypothetical protein